MIWYRWNKLIPESTSLAHLSNSVVIRIVQNEHIYMLSAITQYEIRQCTAHSDIQLLLRRTCVVFFWVFSTKSLTVISTNCLQCNHTGSYAMSTVKNHCWFNKSRLVENATTKTHVVNTNNTRLQQFPVRHTTGHIIFISESTLHLCYSRTSGLQIRCENHHFQTTDKVRYRHLIFTLLSGRYSAKPSMFTEIWKIVCNFKHRSHFALCHFMCIGTSLFENTSNH